MRFEEITGIVVDTMEESKADTTIQRDKPRRHVVIFLKGRKLVWSVSNCIDGRELFPEGLKVLWRVSEGTEEGWIREGVITGNLTNWGMTQGNIYTVNADALTAGMWRHSPRAVGPFVLRSKY